MTIAFRWYNQITVTSWARRCAKRQNLWELLSGKNFLFNILDRKVKPFIYLLQKTLPHPLSVSHSTLSLILKNCPAEIFPLKKKLKKFSILKNSPNPPERPQNLLVRGCPKSRNAVMPETRNAGNQDPEILKPGMTNIH